jgi:hypothetical protein
MTRSISIVALAATMMVGCTEPTERVIIVLDPTVLTNDSVSFEKRVVEPLAASIMALPLNTQLELFLVRPEGNINGGPDHRDSVLFDAYQVVDVDSARRLVANRVTEIARASWQVARSQPNTRASCILSALRRAGGEGREETDEQHAKSNERVALLMISDLREVCNDSGVLFNMEAEIPESFATLTMRGDLSRVDRAYVVLTDGLTNRAADTDERLYTIWADLMVGWGLQSGPARRFEIPARIIP